MMKQSFKTWALVLGLVLLAAGSVLAQEEEEQARLEGKIMDLEKKALPDVEVKLKNLGTGREMATKTNKKGDFFIRTFFPGKYLLTAAKEGYVSHSAEVELAAGDAQRLTINLAKALSQDQKNQQDAFASFQKGIELANEKKFDEAVAAFRTATELNPDFAEAYINLGMLLFQQVKDDEAEKALLKALELKPDEPKTKNALANLYFEKARLLLEADKIDEALELLKTSYSYNPEYSYTSYLLGYAYSKKGNSEEAIKSFEAFLAKEPNSPQAGQVKDIIAKLKKQ